jgi:hypothetical protein
MYKKLGEPPAVAWGSRHARELNLGILQEIFLLKE